jgi:hypothetical protein
MSAIGNLNDRIAIKITNAVSTMWCAYLFCLIALVSLPAILVTAGVVPRSTFPSWMIANGLILIVAWIAQTFIQLVLLSVIMVGQKIQADTTITAVQAHVDKHHNEIKNLHDTLRSDILRVSEHLFKPKEPKVMAAFDEVKQHVEAALEAVAVVVEKDINLQLVEEKLTELDNFLKTLNVPADAPAAPEAPAEPPQPPAEEPAAPAADPGAEAPAPEAPAPETETPAEDAGEGSEEPAPPAPEAPAAPSEEVTPPADGSEPVTGADGNPVTDPNAPR